MYHLFLAWWLATRTAKKNSEKARKETREQLKIMKENSAAVQNHAYKLQFCLKELEKQMYIYEKMTSDANVVLETCKRFVTGKTDNKNVMGVSNDLLNQLHEAMYSLGSLHTLIVAVSPSDVENFNLIFTSLKKISVRVESMSYFLATLTEKIPIEEFMGKFDGDSLPPFIDKTFEMREFIKRLIHKVLGEMG